uniref:Uncharacterized protein n=1 Tax=Amorphochlora amoebiformis TaxID=1561963 RepID=A0A7S0H8C4_9EUKA
MATQAFAMEAVKRKATGRDAVGVGTAVAATKAELKAQLLNSNNDEDTKEEMEKAKQVSCWDAWKFRLMFFIGAGLGAAFIGVSQARNNDRLNIMYGIFWCIWAIIAFGMNWNYASMLSLYKSANEIEETYVKTKAEVGLFARNNAEFKKENDELQKNVEELKHTEGKLSKASKVLQGEVADLKAIQVKVGEMNDRSLKTIEERESIAARQRRIILLQEKEEMEYQSEDILNRIRAYFDDAAGENNTIEKSEYKTLADHIQNIPSLKKSSFKMLKFEVCLSNPIYHVEKLGLKFESIFEYTVYSIVLCRTTRTSTTTM